MQENRRPAPLSPRAYADTYGMTTAPIQDALEALEQAVGRARRQGDAKLPGIRALASSAGVSVATMARAVAQLVSRGVLKSVPRSGIRLVGSARPRGVRSTAPPPARDRYHAVLARVKDDMLRGRYGVRRLFPTIKEFCHRYGVSRQTAVRVLRVLVDDGVLVVTGRSYALAATTVSMARPLKVVYICRSNRGQETVAPTGANMPERLQALESMLEQMGLRLEICFTRYLEQKQVIDRDWGQLSAARARQEGIAGFVVERTAADALFVPLIESLARLRLPIVVMDNHPPYTPPGQVLDPVVGQARVALVHYCLDREMGRDVARYALAMGHRHIAYFHAVEEAAYSADRLYGMRMEMADRECGHVHAVAGNRSASPRPYVRYVLEQAEARVFGELNWDSQTRQALEAAGLVGNGNLLNPTGSNVIELLLEAEPQLLAAAEQALARTDITLWICANERLAVILYHLLRQRKVGIPRDLSFMCMDASIQTMLLRITSYTMAVEEAVSAAVTAVVRPESLWGRRGGGLHRICTTGRVVERGSVVVGPEQSLQRQ